MATETYACDECFDTGTVQTRDSWDTKVDADCSYCDAPSRLRAAAKAEAEERRAAELRAARSRGVQDTIARLTSDEAVELVASGLTPAAWAGDEREAFARRTCAALASLAAEPTTDLEED